MKAKWCWLLLLVGVAVGCLPLGPAEPNDPKPSPPASAAAKPRWPMPPVTPEQVSEANARKKAEELWAEMDRESEDSAPAQEPKPETRK